MARLIGYMANRADRLREAFHQERRAIVGLPANQRGAWGLGFYQGDEVLHKKQPTPNGQAVDWAAVTGHLRTDCVIAHLRQATVGSFSVDNTHPFRLRQWLFAHVGTLAAFDEIKGQLLAELPDFLRRNIRGSSDSELFFHMILAGLHSRNQLESAAPTSGPMLEAIAGAVRRVDELAGSEREPSMLNMLLSNGRAMYALRRGGAFGYIDRVGISDPIEPGAEIAKPGSPELHYVMLVSGGQDVPAGYTALANESVAEVGRNLDITIHRL